MGRKTKTKEEYNSANERIVRKKAIDLFTDRVPYQDAFNTKHDQMVKEIAENNREGAEACVLNFYGEGGIGKSLLSDKLIQELEKKEKGTGCYVKYDFRVSEPSPMEILRSFALSLSDKYKMKFPVFTLSLLIYQNRTQKNLGMSIKELGDTINSNSVIGTLGALAKCFLPMGNLIELYQDLMSVINSNISIKRQAFIEKKLSIKDSCKRRVKTTTKRR